MKPAKIGAKPRVGKLKRRREEALADAIGIRALQTIAAAVSVWLMKRDLLFIAEQLLPLLNQRRREMVAQDRAIKEGESAAKLPTAFVRKAAESTIGKLRMFQEQRRLGRAGKTAG